VDSLTDLVYRLGAWEIVIKHSIGTPQLPEPPAAYVPARIDATRRPPILTSDPMFDAYDVLPAA